MNRRTLLRVAAGAVGGGAATAAGLSVATGGAAETALSLAVDGDSATLATDGSVSAVTLDLDVDWQYDLPNETSPSTVIVEVAAGRMATCRSSRARSRRNCSRRPTARSLSMSG